MSFCGAALLMLSAHWFPSGKEGQLPTTGWFWAVRIRTRGVRQIKHLGARLQQGFWATQPLLFEPCLCWIPVSTLICAHCESWKTQLDTYLDGELPSEEMHVFDDHVRICPSCAADALARAQLKRHVRE